MTAQRQETNQQGVVAVLRLAMTLLAFAACLAGPSGRAATTERVVVNRFTGLAIDGFDPVAYFVEGQPMHGLPDFEVSQAGAVWRFRNPGNQAAFIAHPDVYGPQFGGHDPTDVARGVVVAGNPNFFVIGENRLYLFATEANRDAFAADPGDFLDRARARWPALEARLTR